MSAPRLGRDRRGVVALELAIVGPLLMFLMLAIIELGLAGWTQVVLQLTASQTARCAGLGTTACADPTSYAVNMATGWLYADAVTADGVALKLSTSCNGAPGQYAKVTITSQFRGTSPLPGVLGGGQLSATACYYTGG